LPFGVKGQFVALLYRLPHPFMRCVTSGVDYAEYLDLITAAQNIKRAA
jgi:hypothetical protein